MHLLGPTSLASAQHLEVTTDPDRRSRISFGAIPKAKAMTMSSANNVDKDLGNRHCQVVKTARLLQHLQ